MASGVEPVVGDVSIFGPFRLIAAERLLMKEGERLPLGGRALDILIALVARAGDVVNKRDLMTAVWPDVTVEDANVRVHVSALRKALGDGESGARYIVNIAGRGYCFVAPIHHSPATDEPASAQGTKPRIRQPSLPASLLRIFGRDQSVAAVGALLRQRRFASIVGPGGMGKTTVAVAVAHALADEFDGAVYYIDLSALTEPSLVATTIASALEAYVPAEDPLPGLLSILADRRICLVLDSCEHVIKAVAALAARLIGEAPRLHLLTTSREPLRVAGEHIHLLPPLDGPTDELHLSAADTLSSPAGQLFMERAAASGYNLALSNADAPLVASICRHLDGIPLAIEIAASRVGAFGIRGTAELVSNPLRLLWKGRRNAAPRHQTLAAMLEWSYHLLPQNERKLLDRLSVFFGAFTLEAAQWVAGDNGASDPLIAEAMVSLVDKSLIKISSAEKSISYRLLDTTRAFAAILLEESGDGDAVKKRHALYLSNLPINSNSADIIEFEARKEGAFSFYIGNIRAALKWSFSDRGDAAIGTKLVARVASLFLSASLLSECLYWCKCALRVLIEQNGNPEEQMALRKALSIAKMYTIGHNAEVHSEIERGIDLATSSGDVEHQLHFLTGLSLLYIRRANFEAALATSERNAVVAKKFGLPGIIAAEWRFGHAHHMAGNQAEAQRHCEAGFDLAAASAELRINFFGYDHRVQACVILARTLWLRGYPDRASKANQTALYEIGQCRHPVTRCMALLALAPLLLWSGDLDGAAVALDRALNDSSRHILPCYDAIGFALRGELMILKGAVAEGIALLEPLVAGIGPNNYQISAAAASRTLAEGLVRCGRVSDAKIIIERAVARPATFELPDLLRVQGVISLAEPQANGQMAEKLFIRSLDLARSQSALAWELRSSTALARLWADQGRIEAARDVLADVYQRFTEGFGSPDLRIALELLTDLQAR